MKKKINANDYSSNLKTLTTATKIRSKHDSLVSKTNMKKIIKNQFYYFFLYLLAFSGTATVSVLLLNGNISYSDSQFNPNANDNWWNNYYKQHEPKYQPIDLTNTDNYFKDKTNQINCNVSDAKDQTINFLAILNNIDTNLQTANPNPLEANTNIDDNNILPINFFLNVQYNPAINFTVGDSKTEVDNFSFKVPPNYNDVNTYNLNFTTNNDAQDFGIKNNNNNMTITINIKNQVAVDISKLPLSFPETTISIENPEKTTINSIKDKWLIPPIKDEFISALSKALKVDKNKIKDNYYDISFKDEQNPKDFTQKVTVQFLIATSTTVDNPWHFKGTYSGSIDVINEIADLSKFKDLANTIEKTFDETKGGKGIDVILDNSKDDKNVDTSLTATGIDSVNKTITTTIQTICQDYFKKYLPNLNISENDYNITTDLKIGDNIFKNKLGKNFNITIKASFATYKIKNELDNISSTIHGHNQENISQENKSPNGFTIDGIWLSDGQDKDILQDDDHFYEQKTLLDKWITNKESLLNTINNNSYSPVTNSFNGNFTLDYILDETDKGNMSVNVASDINNGKATNFWDLISKTKSIFLETNVKNGNDRTLNNVKLIFYSTLTNSSNPNDILYTFDLSSKFGISIRTVGVGKLEFPSFTFDIKYQQIS